jgi:hypothetical protein
VIEIGPEHAGFAGHKQLLDETLGQGYARLVGV